MTSPTLLSLADRVEKLTGPCRETDLAISVAINFKGVFGADREWKWSVMADDIEGHKDGKKSFLDPAQFVPRWTASLDVAISALPEGWFWTMCQQPVSAKIWTEGNVAYWVPRGQTDVRPATPVLALLVAILRARSALEANRG